MTREDKELLVHDLSARLPYKVIVQHYIFYRDEYEDVVLDYNVLSNSAICDIKPYLRSMNSMTHDEEDMYSEMYLNPLLDAATNQHTREQDLMLRAKSEYDAIDFLLKNHFDFRGLIKKGLAIEAPEGMYKSDE